MYREEDKTEWFSEDIRPINIGFYETDSIQHGWDEPIMHWDGKVWRGKWATFSAMTSENFKWRGLRFNPNEVKKP